jgi:hypothetical protein
MMAGRFAKKIRDAYPVFLAGKLLGPTPEVRRWIADIERRISADLGPPTILQRLQSLVALAMAVYTGVTLKLDLFQHPRLVRHTFRMPRESRPARAWRRLRGEEAGGHRVEVEKRPWSIVWVRVEGRLAAAGAKRLAEDLRVALDRKKERVVLDLSRLARLEHEAADRMAEGLRNYKDRIRVILPKVGEFASLAAIFTLYR